MTMGEGHQRAWGVAIGHTLLRESILGENSGSLALQLAAQISHVVV